MTATVRETDNYELFHGMGAGFAVLRKSDQKMTNWNTGLEGVQWKGKLVKMSESEFDAACEKETYS